MENEEIELPDWEKRLLDERLKDYYENPNTDLSDIYETLEEIRKTLL